MKNGEKARQMKPSLLNNPTWANNEHNATQATLLCPVEKGKRLNATAETDTTTRDRADLAHGLRAQRLT